MQITTLSAIDGRCDTISPSTLFHQESAIPFKSHAPFSSVDGFVARAGQASSIFLLFYLVCFICNLLHSFTMVFNFPPLVCYLFFISGLSKIAKKSCLQLRAFLTCPVEGISDIGGCLSMFTFWAWWRAFMWTFSVGRGNGLQYETQRRQSA